MSRYAKKPDNALTKQVADKEKPMDRIEFLRKVLIFEDLSDQKIEELAGFLIEIHKRKGEVIFNEGDPGNSLFIIQEGKVEITKQIREDLEQQAGITIFNAGDFFGEMAVIDEKPRSASARATEPTILLEMTKDDFFSICMTEPKVFLSLFKLVTMRIRDSNELLASVLDDMLKKNKLSAIGAAAAKIVHDIKTPITVIILTAQLMENLFPGTQRHVKKIVAQTYILDDMVREILDYAKGGKIVLDIRENDLDAIFNDINESLSLLSKDKFVRLHFENLVNDKVMFDTKRIKRTVTNLIKNAIEAMRDPGKVTITAEKVVDRLHISVSDTGPGIPTDIMEHLFEPFVTKGKANGTGLGLAIAYKVVTDHQGSITAMNLPEGGARFDIYLPFNTPGNGK